jgi:hypothetical protein
LLSYKKGRRKVALVFEVSPSSRDADCAKKEYTGLRLGSQYRDCVIDLHSLYVISRAAADAEVAGREHYELME